MWVTAYFTKDGVPAAGLSPTVKISLVDDGSVVTSGTMSEVGDGFYKYDFFQYDRTKDYMIFCDGVDLPVAERYQALTSGEYGDKIETIRLIDDNVEIRTLLIRKILTNRIELEDGDVNNWKLYDNDDATVLLSWDVTDKSHDEIIQDGYFVSRRSRGK
jgi:hypothetical protein